MQEKISMESHNRNAILLARSLENSNNNYSTDMNYHKRKIAELNDKLQSQQDVIFKQNNTISELRAQNERSISEKRLRKSYWYVRRKMSNFTWVIR